MKIEAVSFISNNKPISFQEERSISVFNESYQQTSLRTAMRRMRHQLSSVSTLANETSLNRVTGYYDVVYKAGWIWPIHIDVQVYEKEGELYAKVTNKTYGVNETHKLVAIAGKAYEFEVADMPRSSIRFSFDRSGAVKKVFLDLPKYGKIEGVLVRR